MAQALAGHKPYLRGAPPGLPFRWDAETLQHGFNFTLATEVGAGDLLGEIPGGGVYAELLPECVEVEVFGAKCRCLSLRQLIRAKRAAGLPKDLEALAELETLDREFRMKHQAERPVQPDLGIKELPGSHFNFGASTPALRIPAYKCLRLGYLR